ncbi:MAG: short-chain dehydrogenase [Mycobacterium sp.]|jgi:short-subunit dehydrogenase|nr:short-chain dehydrogenase [Mycobacterium sp.]
MGGRTKPYWERALVTGASAGIGTAYARELAMQGTNLVLVARNVERLEKLSQELRTDHGVDVEVLAADLSDPRQLTNVEDRLSRSPRPDLVVNNAGMGTFGAFHRHAIDDEVHEIALNVVALVRLTHVAAASMARHGSGTILNVASIMALAPFPGSATYAASKAFVSSFSEALHEELRGTGVTVTVALPGIVATKFMERADANHLEGVPEFAKLTPEFVAKATLRAARKGRATSVPGFGYRIAAVVIGATPRAVLRRLNGVTAHSGVGPLA